MHTPTLGVWYYLVVPLSIMASQGAIQWRDDLRTQALDDAAVEADIVRRRTEGRYDHIFDQPPPQPDLPDDFQSLLKRERRSE